MKIGFLYNHDTAHQIPHTIPVAGTLALRGVDVHILTSSAEQRETAAALLPPAVKFVFRDLKVGPASRAADQILRYIAPFRRIAILRENTNIFKEFDALVVPETTSTFLKTSFGVTSTKLIYIPHGAGDGAAGFQEATKNFDLVLLSGQKVRDRMLASGLITQANHAVIGYPKFDIVLDCKTERFFANGRPTVLYNPHFNPHISSWYPFGRQVLAWFASQDRFNLIFAPHVMLFKRLVHTSLIHRKVGWRGNVPRCLLSHPGILIDTGSRRSIDMSYVRSADIYLGDVSSQIYEWIQRPRPAIFFNTGGSDRHDMEDFRHWSLGPVVDGTGELPAALDNALAHRHAFLLAQLEAIAETFSVTASPARDRAADAIIAFLQDPMPAP